MHPCIVSGYLFNVGKAATEQVAKTAKQFRETVEEKVNDLHERSSLGCSLVNIPLQI